MNVKVKYLFVCGLLAKICAIFLSQPNLASNWYLPFLANSIESFTLDPWGSWLAQNNDPLAFPYGYAMWLILLPATLISHIFSGGLWLAYASTLLIFDFGLLKLLNRLWPERKLAITAIYWCSPVIFIATYLLGYNDIIPITLLILSVLFIKHNKWLWGTLVLAIALSAKLSMILAVPLIMIYYLNKHSSLKKIRGLLYYTTAILLTLAVPLAFNPSLSSMIFNNPEVLKIYSFNITLAEGLAIYIVPLAYIVLLYFFWQIRRVNLDLLLAFIGINFLIIVLLTPASPGWFIW